MILHAPSAYQKSFYQRPVEKDLKGLDGFAKKLAGIWRRRPMVRKPWQQRVEEALAMILLHTRSNRAPNIGTEHRGNSGTQQQVF